MIWKEHKIHQKYLDFASFLEERVPGATWEDGLLVTISNFWCLLFNMWQKPFEHLLITS